INEVTNQGEWRQWRQQVNICRDDLSFIGRQHDARPHGRDTITENAMRTIPWLTAAGVGLVIAGCVGIASVPSQEERQALAPTGKLRVALYVGAPASIIRGATPDESKGVGFDLGKELARRIGVPFEPVVYPSPGAIIGGLKTGEW